MDFATGSGYLWLKLAHIFVAIVALGTSAGLGFVLEFYARDRTHGPYVLRMIERMVQRIVLPGYVIMLVTGLWMASLAWPLTALWIQLALGLWAVGIVCLVVSLLTLRRQRLLHSAGGPAHARYAIASRALGAVFGLIVVTTLYLMLFKP